MFSTETSKSPKDWEVETKEILSRLQREVPQEGLGLGLSRYMLDRRPFALAVQSAQDLGNPASRLADLVCGVPFTSDKHSWPRDKNSGLWMQPIVQLNLATLKRVFQVDWGTGLLQIWGRALQDWSAVDLTEQPVMMRLLPGSDVEAPFEASVPNWRSKDSAKIARFFDESSFVGQEVLDWQYAGDMFGTRQQLLEFCFDKVKDFGDEEFEWVEKVMASISESPLCGENQSDFLGGWGGRDGEQDASYGDGLVLTISDGNGAVVAIHRESQREGDIKFLVGYSLR
jgi:hypothetical protein